MKRNKFIYIIAIICMAVLCMTLLTGCKAKLHKVEGIKYNDGTFSWDDVKGADGYMVYANEAKEIYVTSASVSIDVLSANGGLADKQTNTLYVKAVALDGDGNIKKYSKTAQYEFDYAVSAGAGWNVEFDLNFDGAPEAQTKRVKIGEKFDKPADPQRFGWNFEGWFRDKQCLVEAGFNADGKSEFTVTANTSLYAKWSQDSAVTTTSVYYYSASWTQIKVKPYNGKTELFAGDGIAMAAVAGKANWFKADIGDAATSVIFTNGTDSTESANFDKSKPYCKNGVWSATMPTDIIVDPDHSVCITVGNGSPQQLTENPKVAGEFMIDLALEIGDTVVITIDGKAVSNYDSHCGFTGTATVKGDYSFYVTEERIWVESPAAPSVMSIIINGDTENAKGMKEHPCDDLSVEIQYAVTVTLKKGDTVKIMEGTFEHKNYEKACGFNGTATIEGSYTFYAKKYKDGGDSVWVTVPKNTEVTTTSTKVYFHTGAAGHNWSGVSLYCWNDSTKKSNATWPGEKMTSLGNGWFMLEIEAGYDMIIFNDGKQNNAVQTADLVLVTSNGYAYYDFNGATSDRPTAA